MLPHGRVLLWQPETFQSRLERTMKDDRLITAIKLDRLQCSTATGNSLFDLLVYNLLDPKQLLELKILDFPAGICRLDPYIINDLLV